MQRDNVCIIYLDFSMVFDVVSYGLLVKIWCGILWFTSENEKLKHF